MFTFPLDLPVCFTCPISLKTHGNVSKGHNFLSNNDSHPWFEAFWSQWIYLSKTHRGRIFFKLVVYTYRVISLDFAQWMQFRLAADLTLESARPTWAFSSSRSLPKWSGGKVGGLVKLSFGTNSPLNKYPLNKCI